MFVWEEIFSLVFFCFFFLFLFFVFSVLWVIIYIAGVTEKNGGERLRREETEWKLRGNMKGEDFSRPGLRMSNSKHF